MSVEGLTKQQARWANIPNSIKRMVADELERIAEDLVSDMRQVAPRGATGKLAGSIGWTWGDAPKGTMTLGTVRGQDYGALRITIYAGGGDAFYARFVEFGTVKMPAHPFFFPVWRARKRRTRGRITRAINRAIAQS